MIRITCVLVAFVAFACPSIASAFGPLGHEVVAEIAARRLTPEARREVERLLGDRASNAMRQWASWPDSLREVPPYGPSGPLHYVNFPRGDCRYVQPRDCRNGKCVVEALGRYAAVLRDARSDAERADALKWVIHLVADVHTPLHASWGDDRGGNTVQLQFRGEGWNLHGIWDSGLLKTRRLGSVAYADALLAAPHQPFDASWHGGAVVAWALESCAIVRGGLYPQGRRIDEAYVARNLPILERRLLEAGLRLAEVLNASFRERN
ncbi:MAG TPA: S1/P1 nuclease [Candidatus Saccharimonadia bacterium]|nr:S1/P1 nuclease [Candidatus Saccharimonadia bacterium]